MKTCAGSIYTELAVAIVAQFAFAPAAHGEIGQGDADAIVKRTCAVDKSYIGWLDYRPVPDSKDSKFEWVAVDPERLFFFAAAQAGAVVTDGNARNRVRRAFPQAGPAHNGGEAASVNLDLFNLVAAVQGQIAANQIKTLKAYKADGGELSLGTASMDIFTLDKAELLRCKRALPTEPSKSRFEFTTALRARPEDLALIGDLRKSADAAKLSLVRERSFLDDGSRKQVTTLTMKGVLGVGANLGPDSNLFAYGGYELERARSKPSVTPVPPATDRDGDTEIARFGIWGRQYFDLDPDEHSANHALTVGLGGEYLFDFVKRSERLRALVMLSPYVDAEISGVCGIRQFRTTFIKGVRARCEADGLFQFNHITKDGELTGKATNDFVLAGGRLSYDAMLSRDLESGIVFGAKYERQFRLTGSVPSIKRHQVTLKYRYWRESDFAFEWGIELVDGINPDSFADENKLSLAFGVIF
jgi:hypothetical protein